MWGPFFICAITRCSFYYFKEMHAYTEFHYLHTFNTVSSCSYICAELNGWGKEVFFQICMFVCLYSCPTNFNLDYSLQSALFGMYISWAKHFQTSSVLTSFWPWPSDPRVFTVHIKCRMFHKMYFEIFYLLLITVRVFAYLVRL